MKRVVLLDEWRFSSDAIPLATPLLWYDGRPFVVTRPQNRVGIKGHLLYRGTAPIFVTTKQDYFDAISKEVARAEANDEASEYTYKFTVKADLPRGNTIKACARCFSQVVLHNSAEDPASYPADHPAPTLSGGVPGMSQRAYTWV